MTSQNGSLRPKSGNGFFTVDRRTWDEVCKVGMNEAVAYLVLAQGTGANNRSTSWSSTAIHRYAGVSFERGVAAIEHTISSGFLRHTETHTKARPRYELTSWAKLSQHQFNAKISGLRLDQREILDKIRQHKLTRYSDSVDLLVCEGLVRRQGKALIVCEPECEAESDPIWLPNTIVTGTRNGEESPIKRLRRSGDVWALRLFVDLYHAQNLRDDGGISPQLLRFTFDRKQIGQKGIYAIWAFKAGQEQLWWRGPLKLHQVRKHTDGTEHPVWSSIRLLKQLGLLYFVPHLWESDSSQAEVMYPYGLGWPGAEEIEQRIGVAAHQAAVKMALELKQHEAIREGFDLFAPVPSTIPNCVLIGVARLRYRPHTKRTGAWFSELQKNGSQLISVFNKLSGINELESDGWIKEHQRLSKGFKGF